MAATRLAPGSPEAQAAAAIVAALASGAALENYAADLAAQMNHWLRLPVAPSVAPETNPTVGASAELVEWCRSARDMLALMAGQ